MLEEKKRRALNAVVAGADLAQYGTRNWTEQHRTRALHLIWEALLRGNSPAAMIFVFFHYRVLYAVPGLKDYNFSANYAPIEFVDNTINAQTLEQRCQLLTLMCDLARGDHGSDILRRRLMLTQVFLSNRIIDEFPSDSKGHHLANMLDDSLRNLVKDKGSYGNTEEFFAVAQILEGFAVGV